MPESTHMALWIMSDRTIPRSFRFMEGFGVHTFRLINARGKSTFVKFHWKPKSGMQSVLWNEAVKINGADPDFHRRDLWNAIKAGDFPEWELGLQLFDDEFAEAFDFDVLDPTKIIPEEELPVRLVGRLVLDRTVDNFFLETEQVAFCTQNIVPGIDFSNDPLLQGRNFSYLDTQLKRLGSPNFTFLPINAPQCPFRTLQQDGHMAFVNPDGRANYEPNSWGADAGGPREDHEIGFSSFPAQEQGPKVRERSETFADHFSQARQFFLSQTEIEQQHIINAFVFELSKVQREPIRARMVSQLMNVHDELARAVADGLRLSETPKPAPAARPTRKDLPESPALSILRNGPENFKGRKLGVLISDGTDGALFAGVRDATEAYEASIEIIAPHVGGVEAAGGEWINADQKLDGAPSVLYDAVAFLLTEDAAAALAANPAAVDFASDAYVHCKFIAYTAASLPLLERARVAFDGDEGLVQLDAAEDADAFLEACGALRVWDREAKVMPPPP
jgi:catalase